MFHERTDLAAAKAALSERFLRPRVPPPAATVSFELHVGFEFSNVHAIGIGRKTVAGRITDEAAVRVYVTHKHPASLLGRTNAVPSHIEGIPTDIIEAPRAEFLQGPPCSAQRAAKLRPLVAGISTSHVTGRTGTIGYFCHSLHAGDRADDVFVLSNNHIFAKGNSAAQGDALSQAGATDGGTVSDQIAALHRWVTLRPNGPDNRCDAAIGRLTAAGSSFRAEVCGIGAVAGTARANERDVVEKHGRTTGYTEGIVTDELIDTTLILPGGGSYFFRDQMRIEPVTGYREIALPGDSGSLVVARSTKNAVGLLFAAAPDGSYAYANHIADVLTALQIQLV